MSYGWWCQGTALHPESLPMMAAMTLNYIQKYATKMLQKQGVVFLKASNLRCLLPARNPHGFPRLLQVIQFARGSFQILRVQVPK